MIVRAWQEKDIEIIAQMEARCFSDAWTKDMLADVLKYPLYSSFLLEDGGQVCGYACLIGIPYAEATVANIAVDIPFRGKGLSKMLMDAMHDYAKKIHAEECFLEVRVSNFAAISLYQKYGYEIYGVRAKYYADGEDAYVMKKAL
jgi:ribosomal-protein-alanine N-acetyltransferase